MSILPSFPRCLIVKDDDDMQEWVREAHNRTILTYLAYRECKTSGTPLRDKERAILGIAAGIDAWCRYHREAAMSPFGAEEITRPLYDAFYQALNHDLGRLDARTMARWAEALMTACGVDTN